MKSTNLIIKFWEGALTQGQKNFWKIQKWVSKFCIFGHSGRFGASKSKWLEWALSNFTKSSQNLGTSSCKILDTCLCFKYSKKSSKNAPKMPNKSKTWSYWPLCLLKAVALLFQLNMGNVYCDVTQVLKVAHERVWVYLITFLRVCT